jgi:hypothetical protein
MDNPLVILALWAFAPLWGVVLWLWEYAPWVLVIYGVAAVFQVFIIIGESSRA